MIEKRKRGKNEVLKRVTNKLNHKMMTYYLRQPKPFDHFKEWFYFPMPFLLNLVLR